MTLTIEAPTDAQLDYIRVLCRRCREDDDRYERDDERHAPPERDEQREASRVLAD